MMRIGYAYFRIRGSTENEMVINQQTIMRFTIDMRMRVIIYKRDSLIIRKSYEQLSKCSWTLVKNAGKIIQWKNISYGVF
jgi:hypothetical protein